MDDPTDHEAGPQPSLLVDRRTEEGGLHFARIIRRLGRRRSSAAGWPPKGVSRSLVHPFDRRRTEVLIAVYVNVGFLVDEQATAARGQLAAGIDPPQVAEWVMRTALENKAGA